MSTVRNIKRSINVRFAEPKDDGLYDLYVQGVFNDDFEGPLTFSLGTESSKVTGVIKLSQIFLITLLTSIGSDIFEPQRGTEFASLIDGNFYSKEELRFLVKSSVISAENQVKEKQSAFRSRDADELLQSAELIRLEIVQDQLFPYVLLTSQAGSLSNVQLPALKTQG